MTSPSICQTTHAQIHSGDCPWCGTRLLAGQPSPEPSSRPDDARCWDIARMLADLDAGNEATRVATITNLVEHPPSLDEALPVLNRALGDPIERVRELANQACFRLAGKLDVESVGPYEARLSWDPVDLATLTVVLAVYGSAQFHSEDARATRQKYVLRIIENLPRIELAGTPLANFAPQIDGEVYERAKRLWLEHVEANPRDARLIGNAAAYLAVWDDTLRGELLRRCKALEPENPEWSWHLGNLYALAGDHQSSDSRRDWGAMSLAELERVLALSTDDSKWGSLVLPSLAKAAFDAGEFAKARAYAEDLLARRSARPGPWWPGYCTHQGNLMLGRVALIEGDVEAAKSYLIAAVTAPEPEPAAKYFVAFTPNTALAKDLLERSERTCVIEYLHKCAKLWQNDWGQLANWITDIEQGRIPNFGANLVY